MRILDLDQNVLAFFNGLLIGRSNFLDELVKTVAVYFIYALPVILLILWFAFAKKREALWLSFMACLFSWLAIAKAIVPNIWFRPRPDLGLVGATELLFRRPDYSFPSDHAAALFAITFGLYAFGWKRAGHWFLVYALIVSITRVAVGVHFPLDILAGAAAAAIGVGVAALLKRPLVKYLMDPIVSLMHKVGIK
ncbi:MAG: phosphatase PAP2 family protein [Candidatus Berkelbacteria bacterium]|nr:phosphatase PAP2 family protein [Candidatus Berkelbacteria bacterium]